MSKLPPKRDEIGEQPAQSMRFIRLLFLLSLLLLMSPIAGAISGLVGKTMASLMVFLPLCFVLIAAATAVSDNKRQSKFALILAITCVFVSLPNALTDVMWLSILQDVLVVAFLGFVVQLIVRSLFRRRDADLDTIAASLCAYILIGVMYAAIFSCVIEFDNAAFAADNLEMEAELRFGDYGMASSLYFSFVTLTTLGYGDITPVAVPARILAVSEAVIGQLFLVVLVARLVGLHISQEIAQRHTQDRD